MHHVQESPYRFRVDRRGRMRVPGEVFATSQLMRAPGADEPLEQVANVAALPGIVRASYAMPDMHWGYGFPIGGVAATDVDRGGVVSPGGVGFDISCGVRLLASELSTADFRSRADAIMDRLAAAIPRGAGKGAVREVDGHELEELLRRGSRHVVEAGDGDQRDLDRCEDRGAVDDVDVAQVSSRARERGLQQVGSLGSGNHFAEVQAVAEIRDEAAAAAFGLRQDQVCVMIHCGSRGLGHQVCTDHVRTMDRTAAERGIDVPDRQLSCAPVESPEGRAYLGAMNAAANYGRANRQVLARAASRALRQVTGAELELVYDISHNLAKIEQHEVDGRTLRLCVHRKGATRALPPGHPELPADLSAVGQPVLIPGSMGTGSYVLAGVRPGDAFHSTCHGAGRAMSRHQAQRHVDAKQLRRELENDRISVRAGSARGLAEETPEAYKDVSEVVAAAEGAGLCRVVARLRPLGVVKG